MAAAWPEQQPGPAGPSQRVQVILCASRRRGACQRIDNPHTDRTPSPSCPPACPCPPYPKAYTTKRGNVCTYVHAVCACHSAPLHSTPPRPFWVDQILRCHGLPDGETLPISNHLVPLARVQDEMRWFHCRQAHPPDLARICFGSNPANATSGNGLSTHDTGQ